MAQNLESKLPLAGLLTVIGALVATLIWNRVPLDSNRPPAEAIDQHHQREALQVIDARLWEDPLLVLARHEGEPGPKDAFLEGGRRPKEICEDVVAGKAETHLLLLGVLVPNAPYPDASENRSRIRYAVQSALSVAHFTPQDAQHIGYFDAPKSLGVQLKLPFEVFKRKTGGQSKNSVAKTAAKAKTSAPNTKSEPAASGDFKVVLLWIEEEAIAQQAEGKAQPLQKLNALMLAFANLKQCKARLEAAILGPSNSDTLRAMVHEVKDKPHWNTCFSSKADGPDHCSPLRSFVIYSPFATASGRYLLQLGDGPYAPCSRARSEWPDTDWEALVRSNPRRSGSILNEYFRGCDLTFLSTIATDDQLARALVQEFGRHGLAPAGENSPPYTIAIVSEWDTYYGRMLPKSLMGALGATEKACEDDPAEPRLDQRCRVLRYSYLRGLDGLQAAVGGEKSRPADSARGATPKEESEKAAEQERAQGGRQFDYLRRLSARIREDSARLHDAPTCPLALKSSRSEDRICAIGVVGSDVYDKISVLRALRRDFPHALFFTTDLDARLLDSDQQDWTRNLIVVSGFGLQLSPSVQKWVPPFRSTYQTSAYFASRLALYNAFSDHADMHPGVLAPEYGEEDAQSLSLFPDDWNCPGAGCGCKDSGTSPGWIKEKREALRAPQCVIDRWLGDPRIFEIGRTRAWDLTPIAMPADGSTMADAQALRLPLTPSRGRLAWLGAVLTFALAVLAFTPRVRSLLCEALCCVAPRYSACRRALPGAEAAIGDAQEEWDRRVANMGTVLLFIGAFALLAAACSAFLAYGETLAGTGEPMFWFEGISMWPSELLRLFALILGVVFLLAAWHKTAHSTTEISTKFKLDLPFPAAAAPWWRCSVILGLLPHHLARSEAAAGKSAHAVNRLWTQYCNLANPWYCTRRALALALAVFLMAYGLMLLWGFPGRPARGQWIGRLDIALIAALVVILQTLLFYVADLTRLTDQFGVELARLVTAPGDPARLWPPVLIRSRSFQPAGGTESSARLLHVMTEERVLNVALAIELIAQRTRVLTPLIYYPLIVLTMLVVARWDAFDNWDLPYGLIAVLATSFAICCLTAWAHQRSANRARRDCVAALKAQLVER